MSERFYFKLKRILLYSRLTILFLLCVIHKIAEFIHFRVCWEVPVELDLGVISKMLSKSTFVAPWLGVGAGSLIVDLVLTGAVGGISIPGLRGLKSVVVARGGVAGMGVGAKLVVLYLGVVAGSFGPGLEPVGEVGCGVGAGDNEVEVNPGVGAGPTTL